jgi:hypothetical protein
VRALRDKRQAAPIALAPEGTRDRDWIAEHACIIIIIINK